MVYSGVIRCIIAFTLNLHNNLVKTCFSASLLVWNLSSFLVCSCPAKDEDETVIRNKDILRDGYAPTCENGFIELFKHCSISREIFQAEEF